MGQSGISWNRGEGVIGDGVGYDRGDGGVLSSATTAEVADVFENLSAARLN